MLPSGTDWHSSEYEEPALNAGLASPWKEGLLTIVCARRLRPWGVETATRNWRKG
jgi:hypothetical protein